MKEIVINNQFGCFGLSYKGVMHYTSLKGFKVYAYKQNYNPHVLIEVSEKDAKSSLFIEYYKTPQVSGSKHNNDDYFSDHDILRNDPDLIQTIKDIGSKKASGQCSTLKIIEIPDDTNWVIEEYDGNEWIAEKHQTWS